MAAALDEIQAAIAQVSETVGPAVVGLGRGWGPGSGVVVDAGRVLTSAHNLRGDEPTVTFADGRRAAGRLAGVDPTLDLAVVSVDSGDAPPVEWAPTETAVVTGLPALALANPGGRGLRVTLGFVSAADRSFRGPGGRRLSGGIEHTAPLPRGSSGAPLVDVSGRLLGLNALRLDGGLILAVAAGAELRSRAERLGRGEPTAPPRLGVAVAPPRAARHMRRAVGLPERQGVLVREVEEESPAGRAGIAGGDLIVAAAGREIEGVDDLYKVLDALEPGGRLALSVLRGTDEREVTVSFHADRGGVAV